MGCIILLLDPGIQEPAFSYVWRGGQCLWILGKNGFWLAHAVVHLVTCGEQKRSLKISNQYNERAALYSQGFNKPWLGNILDFNGHKFYSTRYVKSAFE